MNFEIGDNLRQVLLALIAVINTVITGLVVIRSRRPKVVNNEKQ